MSCSLHLRPNESRPLVSFAKAALLLAPLSLAGCHGQARPREALLIEVPAVRGPSSAPGVSAMERPSAPARPEKAQVATTMTLLLAADTFLAYISVPDGSSLRDLEDPKSNFYYSERGSSWQAIDGCGMVFSCDVAALSRAHPAGFVVKAEFSAEGFAPASATFPYHSTAPSFLPP